MAEILDYKSGTKEYILGDTGKSIFISPADAGLPGRLVQFRDETEKYIAKMKRDNNLPEDMDIDTIGAVDTGDIEKDIRIQDELNRRICERLDYAFNYPVSEEVFGVTSSLTLNEDGEYLFEALFNAVLPAVEKEFNARIKKMKTRVKKYTDLKGKHPAQKR